MKAGVTKTVMIVEGDPEYRTLLNKILKNLDCYIIGESSGGEEAINLYERKKPDIVILDIFLPQKHGLEVLKKIKNQEPGQVIIMLTSVSDQQTVKECILAGASGYILKTDSANVIRDRIDKFISDYH